MFSHKAQTRFTSKLLRFAPLSARRGALSPVITKAERVKGGLGKENDGEGRGREGGGGGGEVVRGSGGGRGCRIQLTLANRKVAVLF